MTPENDESTRVAELAAAVPGEAAASPGAMIRAARERARLSIDELASTTKLARHTLEAMERDDFNALLEPVYVRGYYRKCAKILGIPDHELLAAYQGRVEPRTPSAPSKLRLASGTELGSASRLPIALALFFALVAIVVCAFLWFWRGNPETVPASIANRAGTDEPAVEGSPAALPADAGASLPETFPSVPPGTDAPAPADGNAAAPSSSAPTAPVVAPAPVEAPAPASASAAGGALTLEVSLTSWVRVDDAGGKSLFNGLVHAGETREVTGAPPLSVFLGNAPGVKVQFNGKPVDIARSTRDNNTARFTLPLAK